MSPIDQLKAVLCDPEGKCCISGSDEDRAIVDRALQALAAAVPEGWKLVPIEPTEEMIQAGCFSGYQEVDRKKPFTSYAEWADNTSGGIVDRIRGYVEKDYKAMLAAAPGGER